MKVIYAILLLYFAFPIRQVTAQEHVSGLVKNRILEDASAEKRFSLKSFKSYNDTITLPFFDDFSSTTIYPDQKLWADNYAYINSQFGVNPPTIGVATLDALDQNGALYTRASFSSFSADTMTSRFINLNFPVDSNIYLSFFYQAKGLGHMPGPNDSLLVQFYAPLKHAWNTVWATTTDSAEIANDSVVAFKQVLIPVKDTSYLHTAFRFRFRNYASLKMSSSQGSGIAGDNSDWNIDYVYLNKGRNNHDTVQDDIAITAPLPSLLSYYESIPWGHFTNAADELMASGKTSVYYHYYSTNHSDSLGTDRTFSINSLSNNYSYTFGPNANNIHAGTTMLYEPYYEKLSYDGNDSALFAVKFFLSNYGLRNNSAYRWNDTVRRVQIFKDYYAYDDGTAENGYGIDGSNTSNARVAYQFFCFKPDSLRAIDMYFNDVYNDANGVIFNLTVWDSNSGPGNVLFSRADTNFYPKFESRNHFIRYVLDQPLAIQDTFYVGWIQDGPGFLNVGLDVNHISTSKIFYNITGQWQMSSVKGSLMIRPVFGKRITTGLAENTSPLNIRIYPNPASEMILLENTDNTQLKLSFFDLSGKLLLSSICSDVPVNISSLPTGLYIVRIENGKSLPVFSKLRVLR